MEIAEYGMLDADWSILLTFNFQNSRQCWPLNFVHRVKANAVGYEKKRMQMEKYPRPPIPLMSRIYE